MDFSKRNLIYGWNYSGKTTLSRVLRSFEKKRNHPDFPGGYQLLIAAGDRKTIVSNPEHDLPFLVRVFNSDYIAENLHWEDGVDPILILGARNRELQAQRNECITEISELTKQIDGKQEVIRLIKDFLDKTETDHARQISKDLELRPFNRGHLRQHIQRRPTNLKKWLLSDDEYNKYLRKSQSESLPELSYIPTIDETNFTQLDIASLLAESAQQNALKELQVNPALEQWIEKGLSLHEDNERCKFCTNPLPPKRLHRLSEHFSDSFRNLQTRVNDAISLIQELHLEPQLHDETRLYSHLRDEYLRLHGKIIRTTETINKTLAKEKQTLKSKLQSLHKSVSYTPVLEIQSIRSLNSMIERVNELIKDHNKRTQDFVAIQNSTQTKLLNHRIATSLRDTNRLEKEAKIVRLENKIAKLNQEVASQRQKVAEIDGRISEETIGAERLNDYLRIFLSGTKLEIVLRKDKRFDLRRDGRKATNLSEGEETAIAFAYFLTRLHATDTTLANTIVYIDDPISSLDTNHIYSVFAAIQNELRDALQIFISTHNYSFFKLLQRDSFFREKTGDKQPKRRTSLYYIERNEDGAGITNLPDIIRKYKSEYHYLFSVMYAFQADSTTQTEAAVTIPNIARRVLETYTSFKYPKHETNLRQRLEGLCKDRVITTRIYKLVNHLSHSEGLHFLEEPPSVEECRTVVNDILNIIKNTDRTHFNEMEAMCREMGLSAVAMEAHKQTAATRE